MANRLENIFLMRHGDSTGNQDLAVYKNTPDFAIDLAPLGKQRVMAAGAWFKDYLATGAVNIEPGSVRPWTSGYYRTTQSCDGFLQGFNQPGFFLEPRKDIALIEQRFGLFDGLTDKERAERFPEEWRTFEICRKYPEGRFYTRPPNGESRLDVCTRVRPFFGTIIRDAEKTINNVPNVFLFSHGVTVRAFIMMWLHLDVKWFEQEPNPNNASIRHIGRDANGRWKDFGYIFDGQLKR